MNIIRRKITIIGDMFSFSFIEDETEYTQDLLEAESNSFTNKSIYNYFSEGEFTDDEVQNLNGKHFIFGFLESLYQSDRCPDFLYSYKGKLKYKVEKI